MPEYVGMFFAANGHIFDYGLPLYPQLPLLFGRTGAR